MRSSSQGRWALVSVLGLFLCGSQASAAKAKVGPLDLDGFVKAGLGAYESSQVASSIGKSLESNVASYQSAMEQSPFTNRTDLSRAVFSTDNDAIDLATF